MEAPSLSSLKKKDLFLSEEGPKQAYNKHVYNQELQLIKPQPLS